MEGMRILFYICVIFIFIAYSERTDVINMIVTPSHHVFAATVIGAGPAGVALMGCLLDQLSFSKNSGITTTSSSSVQNPSILWIDPQFQSGRLYKYQKIPSNTKVKYFLRFIEASPTFNFFHNYYHNRTDTECKINDPLIELQNFDPNKECLLKYPYEMILRLTSAIRNFYSSQIAFEKDIVKSMNWNDQLNTWEIKITTDQSKIFYSDFVFLATGSHPKGIEKCAMSLNLPIGPLINETESSYISLDDALDPDHLKQRISASDVVAVVGSSHSAMLVLKNLHELPPSIRPKRILQIYRSPFIYAQDMTPEDWILHDNTGLKGAVADWTKKMIDTEFTSGGKILMNGLKRYHTSDIALKESLKDVKKYIVATGFERNKLPLITYQKKTLDSDKINYDSQIGQILYEEKKIPNLFGYGIAFPQKVTDPLGNVEEAVGLWKFMKYMKQVIPKLSLGKKKEPSDVSLSLKR